MKNRIRLSLAVTLAASGALFTGCGSAAANYPHPAATGISHHGNPTLQMIREINAQHARSHGARNLASLLSK